VFLVVLGKQAGPAQTGKRLNPDLRRQNYARLAVLSVTCHWVLSQVAFPWAADLKPRSGASRRPEAEKSGLVIPAPIAVDHPLILRLIP